MRRRSGIWRIIGETLLVGVSSAIVFVAGLAALSTSPPPGAGEAARQAVVGRGLGGGWAAPDAVELRTADDPGEPRGVPVLCYHYLRPRTSPQEFLKILGALFFNLPLLDKMDIWTQSAAMFEAQMDWLERNGYETVDLVDVIEWRNGRKTLPRKPIVITFDDGDRSVLEYAFPILREHRFKATLFVVTSQVGRKWDRVDCLSWDELRRLRESGVFDIQSHSHDLHRKVKTREGDLPVFVAARWGLHDMRGGGSWEEAVYRDLRRSKELIERNAGSRVRCLAWPYGFGDAELDRVAESAGYSVLCTLGEGFNYPARFKTAGGVRHASSSVFRHTMTARTSLRAFEAALAEPPRPTR